MSRNQLRYAEVVAEIHRLENSREVRLALKEQELLELHRQTLDELQRLYDRGRELIEEGFDVEVMDFD